MRPSTIASVLALTGAAIAQSNYPNQSAPFNLQFISDDDESLNGTYIGACHTGAAIESLCTLGSSNRNNYYLNYTMYPSENVGLLTWNLVGNGFVASSPMNIFYSIGTDVAQLLLQPSSNGLHVTFDDNNKMAISNSIDDTVTPPKYITPAELLYRWHVCLTNYLGYNYNTLTWVLGNDKPQNPSCKKVDVLRTFV
ncbi:hypothetical protein EJ05DRAFT_473427 [Pseudovirgaria hyperparasitica]|uniref:DUF7907 domain-containing protein n=1 Tax=Pseudovirgaria hyperparasitica TaxID=470096 RepID=A0A6A6WE74_9PEZI|nr:uncharacterized protein EJ05DRAFT_473427 [Pseudovirgaria hyperparasitica]KAF2760835.1 hypothetical protein EJ05DRAFT_473427 [Pseudovirgaria hyperparasitica]